MYVSVPPDFIPGGNTMTLGFDAVGNRITRSDVTAPGTTLTYAGTSNRLPGAVQGTLTRTYTTNAVGDVTGFTGADGVANTLTYDPFGRLTSHTRSGVTTTYGVNALDQRMTKAGPAVADMTYVYAGQNQLLAESNANGRTSYVWNGNEPVALVRGNQIYYIHDDHLGRPEKVINSARAIVWRANNFGFNRSVALDAIGGLNLGFPGQYWDSESGLWHNGYRDYEGSLGRYLQSDPIGLEGGGNTYVYAQGNPVRNIDPDGLQTYGPGVVPTMDPCMAGAFLESIWNLSPIGGLVNTFSPDGTSLDVGSGTFTAFGMTLDLSMGRANAKARQQLDQLRNGVVKYPKRQEQLVNSIRDRAALTEGLRRLGKAFTAIGVATEIPNFMENVQKCTCGAEAK